MDQAKHYNNLAKLGTAYITLRAMNENERRKKEQKKTGDNIPFFLKHIKD